MSQAAAARRRAILTPELDLLVGGGLWVLLGVPLLVGGVPASLEAWAGRNALLLTALINAPHFMASYWLLYSSREQARRHPWASFGVPALLVAWVLVALVLCGRGDARALVALQGVAGAYLAWHYTGQAWGMMASYAYLDGLAWAPRERALVRLGLRLLLAWHVAWFLRVGAETPEGLRAALGALRPLLDATALASVPLGLAAFVLVARRTGRPPSLRVLAPWVAVHLWYVALWISPAALLWVQLGHALQYLAFPARVELNRRAPSGALGAGAYLAFYALLLVVAGALVFDLLPRWVLAKPVEALLGADARAALPALVGAAVNIHHYFTDGCVWKVSNPDVRRALFSHVTPTGAPAAVAVTGPAGPTPAGP